jgi:hypothetical protein
MFTGEHRCLADGVGLFALPTPVRAMFPPSEEEASCSGFLCRTDGDTHRALRAAHPGPSSTSRCPLQCDGTFHRRVDHTAGRRLLPIGRGPSVSAAGSRPHLQRLVSPTGALYGNLRSHHSAMVAMAEPLR